MRTLNFVTASVLGALLLAGCPVKPKTGECRTSADCAAAGGQGSVCVEGRCQECGADADCKAGFVCRSWKCLPRPECAADDDCPSGKSCRNERCVAAERQRECASHADCGEGKSCDADGRCVAAASNAGDAACADPATYVVRFGFDEATLTPDTRDRLQKVADCLRKRPAARVVLTGHCDERGTTQYNLALGSRRAEAARKFLGELGTAGQLETVTMGKERPLCAEATEACWALNRRAEIMVSR
jgi:peptidoglycan-associated lipoprotein